MATLTSKLVVELMDKVSEPARRVSNSLAGITNTVQETNAQPTSFNDRLNSAITRNDRALSKARGGIVDAAAGFYALKAAIGGPVAAATDFGSAMADVTKVVDFETPEAFEDFKRELFDMSREIPVAVDGLAQIAAAAGQSGIAGDELIEFTRAAAMVGTAFDISADAAGQGMAKMRTGLGMTTDETIVLADAMNHLSNKQASSAAEIMDVVQTVGAQGKTFGLAAKDTAAFASAMIASGAESNVAATSIRNMGRALTKGESATKRQSDAYEALGLNASDVAASMQEDATGTIVDVLERLAQIPKEAQAAVSSDLFGNESRALGPLLGNIDLVRESLGYVAEENEFAGSSFDEAQRRMDTFGGGVETFKNQLSELAVEIGDSLLPGLERIMDALRPIISNFAEFARKNPNLTSSVVAVTGSVIGLRVAIAAFKYLGLLGRGGVLQGISAGLKLVGATAVPLADAVKQSVGLQKSLAAMAGTKLGFLGTIKAGFSGIAGITGLAAVKTAIAGVVTVIAGISAPVWIGVAAAVAAVAAAWKYWDRLTAIVSGVGSAIMDELQPMIDWVSEKLEPVQWLIEPIAGAFTSMVDGIKNAVSGIRDFFTGGFFSKEELGEDEFASIEAKSKEVAASIIGAFKDLGRNLIDWFAGIPDRILAAIGSIDLSGLISFGEPPRWLRWLMGDEEIDPKAAPIAAPDIAAEAAQAGQTPAQRAAEIISTTNVPAAEDFAEARAEADRLRTTIANIELDIKTTPSNRGGEAEIKRLQKSLIPLEDELAVVEDDLATMEQATADVEEALRILGETETTPEINTTSIDRARDRVRRLRNEMTAAEGGATAPQVPVPEIDGARAGGGPVNRDDTYLVGEEGPELVTPTRSGFVNSFQDIARSVGAIRRLSSAVNAVQSVGPELAAPSSASYVPEDIDVPAPEVAQQEQVAVQAPEVAQQEQVKDPAPQAAAPPTFPKIDVQISIAPTIHTAERVDPAQLSRAIGEQMRIEVREAFRGVFADTSMRFS